MVHAFQVATAQLPLPTFPRVPLLLHGFRCRRHKRDTRCGCCVRDSRYSRYSRYLARLQLLLQASIRLDQIVKLTPQQLALAFLVAPLALERVVPRLVVCDRRLRVAVGARAFALLLVELPAMSVTRSLHVACNVRYTLVTRCLQRPLHARYTLQLSSTAT